MGQMKKLDESVRQTAALLHHLLDTLTPEATRKRLAIHEINTRIDGMDAGAEAKEYTRVAMLSAYLDIEKGRSEK